MCKMRAQRSSLLLCHCISARNGATRPADRPTMSEVLVCGRQADNKTDFWLSLSFGDHLALMPRLAEKLKCRTCCHRLRRNVVRATGAAELLSPWLPPWFFFHLSLEPRRASHRFFGNSTVLRSPLIWVSAASMADLGVFSSLDSRTWSRGAAASFDKSLKNTPQALALREDL